MSAYLQSAVACAAILGVVALFYHPSATVNSVAKASVDTIVTEHFGNDELIAPLAPAPPPCEETCKETYDFMPCSTSAGGSLTLMFFYCMVLLWGANCIGDGGEALLNLGVMSPSFIGGVLLPILGAVPDAVIIIVSGAGGSVAHAERRISVGVGTLAGSTIMLLTLLYSSCLFVGRCDLDEDGKAIDGTLKGESYKGKQKRGQHEKEYEDMCGQLSTTGVTHHDSVLKYKWFMLDTCCLYIITQVLACIFGHNSSGTRTSMGIMAIVAFVSLFVYLGISFFSDFGEEMTEAVKNRRLQELLYAYQDACESQKSSQLFPEAASNHLDVLDSTTGKANKKAIRKLFHAFDFDGNGVLSEKEIGGFTNLVFMHGTGGEHDTEIVTRMKNDLLQTQILRDSNKATQEDESKADTPTLPNTAGPLKRGKSGLAPAQKEGHFNIDKDVFVERVAFLLEEEAKLLNEASKAQEQTDEDDEEEQTEWTMTQAALHILFGTILVTVFSDGVVGSIDSFGAATGIPNFVIGFIVCPFASNASEFISSIRFAMSKKKDTASVTFSQIYAACVMNNTMCLGSLLALIWLRELQWVYKAECICIVVATLVIGFGTGTSATLKLWFSLVALAVYPCSLLLVEMLHRLEVE